VKATKNTLTITEGNSLLHFNPDEIVFIRGRRGTVTDGEWNLAIRWKNSDDCTSVTLTDEQVAILLASLGVRAEGSDGE
jgi:hypothetical protein